MYTHTHTHAHIATRPSVIMLLTLSGGPQSTPATLVFIKARLTIVYYSIV